VTGAHADCPENASATVKFAAIDPEHRAGLVPDPRAARGGDDQAARAATEAAMIMLGAVGKKSSLPAQTAPSRTSPRQRSRSAAVRGEASRRDQAAASWATMPSSQTQKVGRSVPAAGG